MAAPRLDDPFGSHRDTLSAAFFGGVVSYFDKRWMTVRFDETIQAVWLEWKGYAEGEEYRSGFNFGVDLLEQKKASRWLGDCRLLGPVSQADQQWTNQDWHPRAAAAGMRWVALVSPKAAVARMSLRYIITRVNNADLVFNNFDDMESARQWLRAPTKPI